MTDIDVVIVGGGISGLTAARELSGRGVRVRLFEREPACGGLVRTDHMDGFVVDAGPDTLLTHKPAAVELVRELGLDAGLVAPSARRTTYLVRGTALRTLPETSAMGLPTSLRTLVAAQAFSWRGKLRMAAEPLIPPSATLADESIGSFVRRRFGREAVTSVAEPLLAGIHRGDADRLSLRALFPLLAHAERTHGSVARAWRRMAVPPGRAGSLSLRGGLGQIAVRLQEQLPCEVVVARAEVRAVERSHGAFAIRLGDGTSVAARAVLLATPAHVTAQLAGTIDEEVAVLCGGIRYAPSVNVALGYARSDVSHPLNGWGFVVPASERRSVRSATWVSSKWPDRAPAGLVLIRASLSAVPEEALLDEPDDRLIARTHADLNDVLGISAAPAAARVYRLPRAMPQLEVGHLERMAAIERRLAAVPGLFVSAAGFRGIGLPDCIADARAVSAEIALFVRNGARGAVRSRAAAHGGA